MAVTIADIRRLRRMVNELSQDVYSDDELALYLVAWPLIDSEGRSWDEDDWVASYDLHAAAADVWEEKAAKHQPQHDFSADGATYQSSQMFDMAMEQARYHRARQKARVKVVAKRPEESTGSLLDERWIANIDPVDEDDMPFEDWWKL